ncbi:MAG: hypothetical protein OXC30_06165 [Alphaproteobacteria bacterium]|nr:hypothetical protein [Alphaproteobacteria bacterium]
MAQAIRDATPSSHARKSNRQTSDLMKYSDKRDKSCAAKESSVMPVLRFYSGNPSVRMLGLNKEEIALLPR